MGEIITAYPTSEISSKNCINVAQKIIKFIKTIPSINDFFDSITTLGGNNTLYDGVGIKFSKGATYITLRGADDKYSLYLQNSTETSDTNASSKTSSTFQNDIPITYAIGTNGTTAIWFDNYSKNVCMVFGKYNGKFFIANSSIKSTNEALIYADTSSGVNILTNPFNGSNISTGGDFIAQPYYHLGINTGDIYTFDGGSSLIPWGKFNLNNAEFVRLTGNFALRIK